MSLLREMPATQQSYMAALENTDPEIFAIIQDEQHRQKYGIELIASENYVSSAVLAAQGSILTNKYAEGYPGKRYYGGCEVVDRAEELAIARAKELFGAEHVNVQPHSGSQANFAAYLALLEPGDTIMAMRLDQGGHLTHGSPVNVSGKLFHFVAYGVNPETEFIDYEQMEAMALEHKPKAILSGATAYPRAFDFRRIREICDKVGALMYVDIAHIAGLIAANLHPDPLPLADVVTSTTHKTLRGPRGGIIMCKAQYAKAIDKSIFPFSQGGPLMHIIAAKAVAFHEALQPSFKVYQQHIVENASTLAATLKAEGLRPVSGGTDNHMMLIDLTSTNLTGKDAEKLLDTVHITVNKNTIPNDKRSPFVASGIRLGSPAVTSRGFTVSDMQETGRLVAMTLHDPANEGVLQEVRQRVHAICERHPVPGIDA